MIKSCFAALMTGWLAVFAVQAESTSIEDFLEESGLQIDGIAPGSSTIFGEGDYNGDGIADLVFSAPNGDPVVNGVTLRGAGEVYVLFGHPTVSPGMVDRTATVGGSHLAVITGEATADRIGTMLGAADLTNDGIDDLIIGAPGADLFAFNLGIVYVIYGRREGFPATMNVGDLRTPDNTNSGLGFVVQGSQPNGFAGTSLTALEDFNGDGLTDLLIGASVGVSGSVTAGQRGQSLILFGRDGALAWPATFSTFDARESLQGGEIGTLIRSGEPQDRAGAASASAGDVDGDGLSDILLGAPIGVGLEGGENAGYVDLIAGRSVYDGDIRLADTTSSGVITRFYGTAEVSDGTRFEDLEHDNAGSSIITVEDFNGDGLRDVVIGAQLAGEGRGHVYVVYGRNPGNLWRREVVLEDLVQAGTAVRIVGDGQKDQIGNSLAPAGDLNGDGLSDLLLGSRDSGPSGSTYVVFGTRSKKTIDLAVASSRFIRIQGAAEGDFLGSSVAGRGDFNADGSNDYAMTAPRSRGDFGTAYLIFGDGDDGAPPMTGALSHVNYDVALPGQGVTIEYGLLDGSPALFAVWYTFENGQPLWLVSDLSPIEAGARSLETELFVTTGGRFGAAFDPDLVETASWGSVRVTQTRCDRVLWEYTRAADGATGRLVLTPTLANLLGQDQCTLADRATGTLDARRLVTGTFWNPARAGEGVVLDLEPRGPTPTLFFSWFTYADQRQVWLVGSAPFDVSSGRVEGLPVFSARGAEFGAEFDPADVELQPWGEVSLEFAGCGDLALRFQGAFAGTEEVSGAIDLQRFTGGLADFACR